MLPIQYSIFVLKLPRKAQGRGQTAEEKKYQEKMPVVGLKPTFQKIFVSRCTAL
jgi:hypothetical protein